MLSANQNKNNRTQELISASVKALCEALEAGKSEALTAYLDTMARFHRYSFGNIVAIATQRPGATQVAGVWSWNQLGRRVKRGEKGILILSPRFGRKRTETAHSENALSDAKSAEPQRADWT